MAGFADSFLVGVKTAVVDVGNGAAESAKSFISGKAASASSMIGVGPAPAGNLTAEQIASGARGAPPQGAVNPSKQDPASIANAAAAGSAKVAGVSVMTLAAIAVVAWFFLKGRK